MNEEQTNLCSECGAAVTEEYLHEFDERILCSSCLDSLTTICNCCGERIWRSDDEGDGSISLCSGYRSHQTQTCGLHIHVSRSAFGKDYTTQEDAISRIVHFVEMHWNELLKFSRRTEENINRWASRYGISITAKDTYKNAKEKHCGRYVAVNLENYATIEFRLFRGTLRYKTFLATLQLVDEICLLAIKLTDKKLESLSWSDLVNQINDDKSELIDCLKAKRLYVNEPIANPIETEVE